MESVLRGLAIYVFLLLITRIAGRRTLSEMTNFDFVLLLVIGEATQQGLLGEDFSVMNAMVIIVTLVFADIVLSLVKRQFPTMDKVLDGVPTVLIRDGVIQGEVLKKSRIEIDDVLEAARRSQGLAKLSEVRYAVLEKDGAISIIPYK